MVVREFKELHEGFVFYKWMSVAVANRRIKWQWVKHEVRARFDPEEVPWEKGQPPVISHHVVYRYWSPKRGWHYEHDEEWLMSVNTMMSLSAFKPGKDPWGKDLDK
jgi:hypothetical protein